MPMPSFRALEAKLTTYSFLHLIVSYILSCFLFHLHILVFPFSCYFHTPHEILLFLTVAPVPLPSSLSTPHLHLLSRLLRTSLTTCSSNSYILPLSVFQVISPGYSSWELTAVCNFMYVNRPIELNLIKLELCLLYMNLIISWEMNWLYMHLKLHRRNLAILLFLRSVPEILFRESDNHMSINHLKFINIKSVLEEMWGSNSGYKWNGGSFSFLSSIEISYMLAVESSWNVLWPGLIKTGKDSMYNSFKVYLYWF